MPRCSTLLKFIKIPTHLKRDTCEGFASRVETRDYKSTTTVTTPESPRFQLSQKQLLFFRGQSKFSINSKCRLIVFG